MRTHAIAARRLCCVKRRVGAAEDGIDVRFTRQCLGDAETGGELDRAARAEDGGCRKTSAKVFGNTRCTFRGRVGQNEEELLAAIPASFVADAECLAQDPSDADENLVAAEMPLPVVDRFEVIEVEHHDRQRHVRALRAAQFGPEPLDAVVPGHASGQRFDDGEIANLAEKLHVLDRDRQQRRGGVENLPLLLGERQVVVANAQDTDEFLLRDEGERMPGRLARTGGARPPLQPPRSNHRLPSTFLGREPEIVAGHERLKMVDDHLLQRLRVERLRERLREPHQHFELAGTILQEQSSLAQRAQLPAARLLVDPVGLEQGERCDSDQHDDCARDGGEGRRREADDRPFDRAAQQGYSGDRANDSDAKPHRQACARAARRRTACSAAARRAAARLGAGQCGTARRRFVDLV